MLFQDELILLALVLAFAGCAYHAWRTTPRPRPLPYEEQSLAGPCPFYTEKGKRPV